MAVSRKKKSKKILKTGKDLVETSVEDFKDKLIKTINQNIDELTIDLKNIKDIDSTGIGVLIAAKNSLDQAGGQLNLTNVPENIGSVLHILGLEGFFNLSTT